MQPSLRPGCARGRPGLWCVGVCFQSNQLKGNRLQISIKSDGLSIFIESDDESEFEFVDQLTQNVCAFMFGDECEEVDDEVEPEEEETESGNEWQLTIRRLGNENCELRALLLQCEAERDEMREALSNVHSRLSFARLHCPTLHIDSATTIASLIEQTAPYASPTA